MERPVVGSERPGIDAFDHAQGFGETRAREVVGMRAGEQLVQEDTQGIDVGARVDGRRIAARLLGAHVRERPDELADASAARRRASIGIARVRDAEVEHLGLAEGIDEDVVGLEIAMHDALLVGVLDGFCELDEQA